jgi:hypothetical protein
MPKPRPRLDPTLDAMELLLTRRQIEWIMRTRVFDHPGDVLAPAGRCRYRGPGGHMAYGRDHQAAGAGRP